MLVYGLEHAFDRGEEHCCFVLREVEKQRSPRRLADAPGRKEHHRHAAE